MKKIFSLLAVILLLNIITYSQERQVTGQVKDERSQPVPFATISETNNSNNATTADLTGNFKITITSNSLTVSSAGFQTKTVTVTGNTVTITLSSAGQLQEVVVTALGIRRTRNQVPYAAQQINGCKR